MSIHVGRDLTDQLISILTVGGLTVGDAIAPSSVPAGSGYVVVYPLTGGTFSGELGDPYEEARADYQLTSVGSSRKACEWVTDKVFSLMLAATFTLTGRGVIQVEPVFMGGVARDDDVQPPIFYAPNRWTIWTGST